MYSCSFASSSPRALMTLCAQSYASISKCFVLISPRRRLHPNPLASRICSGPADARTAKIFCRHPRGRIGHPEARHAEAGGATSAQQGACASGDTDLQTGTQAQARTQAHARTQTCRQTRRQAATHTHRPAHARREQTRRQTGHTDRGRRRRSISALCTARRALHTSAEESQPFRLE